MFVIFMQKHAENVHQRLVPDSFLILVKNPKQPLHARNISKIRYFERRLVRSRKTVTFIFYFEPSPHSRSQSTL